MKIAPFTKKRTLRAALGVSALLWAGSAQANLFDTFGAGARSQGLAGANGVLEGDAFSSFHNPASMTWAAPGIGLGVSGLFNRSEIRLKPRPTGYDPPGYGDRRMRPESVTPPGVAGATIGFVLPLFINDLFLGGSILFPFSGFGYANTQFNDEREQIFSNNLHFELLGERMRGEVLSFALGYRIFDWLSMGVGILVLPANRTTTYVYTPNATDPSDVEINLNIEQSARWALNVGLVAEPIPSLRLGLAFKDEMYFEVGGENRVMIRGESEAEPVLQDLNFISGYQPPQLTASIAGIDLWGLTAAFELNWRGWRRYLDNHGQQPKFNNTLEYRLGLEYAMAKHTRLRAGGGYIPSPIAEQDGRTNYIDNDRLFASLGAGRDFSVGDYNFTADLSVQLHGLLGRDVNKALRSDGRYPDCAEGGAALCDELPDDRGGLFLGGEETQGLQTGNPGFPGYTHGGYLVVTSIDLTWRF